MIKKLKTIFLSRIKNNKEEKWIQERLNTCLECKFNTLNGGSLKGYRFFLANLSALYSWIMGRSKEDTYGICTACEACSVYFKASEKLETCRKNKWKTLEDGSIKLNIREQRKNESK